MHLILANYDFADFQCALERLTAGQKARLKAIRHEKRRLQFVWSRIIYNGLMRRITGHQPTFELIPHQPHPSFEHDGIRYYTSLTHSEQWVAVAFDTSPIAIDLEAMKPRHWQTMADFSFDEKTSQWIENSVDPLQAFYLMWGQRECEIKMQSWGVQSCLFRGCTIKTQPYELMLTALTSPQSTWQPQILPTTLLENF